MKVQKNCCGLGLGGWRVVLSALVVLVGACSEVVLATEAGVGAGAGAGGSGSGSEDGGESESAGEGNPLLNIMSPGEADPDATRGVKVREPGALDGVTLVAPLNSKKVHLVDLAGEVVHTWETDSSPGAACYLLEDGMLLRAGREDEDPRFSGGGIGGRVQKLAPDGSVVWHYGLADEQQHQHHDVEPLPNGNVLLIAWERKSAVEAVARGRDPRGVGKAGFWPDAVYEVRPNLPVGGEIVWEWHAWDHLVQEFDPEKPNYGVIAENPWRIDINAGFVPEEEISEEERKEQEELEDQMAALGYADSGDEEEPEDEEPRGVDRSGDWLHTNSVDYHAELDLIVLSSPNLCELWVIDHSTTSEEAAGSKGGRFGRGGDLLWRWGNPAMHGAGDEGAQKLFYQHNPTWLTGIGGARLLVFNNGGGRADGSGWSSVEELVLPLDPDTGFRFELGEPCQPSEPVWTYSSPETFFSAFISGAQRLANGNTVVCSGAAGRVFELTSDKRIVWDYWNPLGGDVEPPEHAGNAPPLALFRAERLPSDHPGVRALLDG